MTLNRWRYGLAAAVAVGLGLLSIASLSVSWVQGQPPCTVTVQPGQSIQEAINAAPAGAVICLGAGYFVESLLIRENLTLRGIYGSYASTLRNSKDGETVISVQSDSQITVSIEDLSVVVDASEKFGVVGIYATGQAAVTLRNVAIRGTGNNAYFPISWGPLIADASAQLRIVNSLIIGDTYGLGIWLEDSAKLSVENSTISGYPYGITVVRYANVSVIDSIISRNGVGISAWDWNQVDVRGTAVFGNGQGLRIGGKSKLVISRSRILGNETNGFWIYGSAEVQIKDNLIMGNGTHPRCWEPGAAGWWEQKVCNGIELSEEAQLTISDSTLVSNADWAITIRQEACGYIPNEFNGFRGKVLFLGINKIENNNQTGNQTGMGNPGNHPWNRPDIPDGQVCLP